MQDATAKEPGNCAQILDLPILTIGEILAADHTKEKDQLIACIYFNFREIFIKSAQIRYNYIGNDESVFFIAESAFTDAVLVLIRYAVSGKLYEGNKGIRAVLWTLFWFQMLAGMKSVMRQSANKEKYTVYYNQYHSGTEENWQDKEKRLLAIDKGLSIINTDCSNLIQWWHKELKSLDEISQMLAMDKKLVTDRIYRCMKKLKAILKPSKSNEDDNE